MSAAVRISVREQVGERIVQQVAEGDTFDECYAALCELRARAASKLQEQAQCSSGAAVQESTLAA